MNDLYNKLLTYDFKSLFDKKGYKYFEGHNYDLNIIGIRSANDHKVTNAFDDYIVVLYNTRTRRGCRAIYKVTTQPGVSYMENPCNTNGTAILAEGQYRAAYKLGKHKGQNALIQNKPLKVYRDNNKDKVYDYKTSSLRTGMYGINIHRAGKNSTQINNWSAGCQVFAIDSEFESFLRLCNKQVECKYGETFTYTLINEREL